MSKKNFSGGLDSLLGDQPDKAKRGRPKTNFKEVSKASEEGTIEGETRATFIVNKERLEKLKALAYWERLSIKAVINAALQEYIDKHEKKSGDIKPIPKQ